MFRRTNFLRLPLLSLVLLSLVSCGGGGSSKTEPPIVEPPKEPVVISGSPILSINENNTYTFSVQTSNFSTQSIVFSVENLPSWADFDSSTGVLSGLPSYNDAGLYNDILITASDGSNGASLPVFTIEVINVYELSGTVVDGYIQGALVYIDENNNSQFDENEISAITNNEGQYVLYCEPERLFTLDNSPIRAYIGDGAQDMSRPELNFSEVPITLSLAPVNIQIEDDLVVNQLVISPYTNEVAVQTQPFIDQLHNGEITKEAFQANVEEAEEMLTATILNDSNIDLASIDTTEDEFSSIIFSDFLLVNEIMPELEELGRRKVDLLIVESDIRDFDADGIANNVDSDDDNDGVVDINDLFPFDSSESQDSDLDGVGDNADFYSSDVNCFEQLQGNGDSCYASILLDTTIAKIEANGNGQYYYYLADETLLTFDATSNTFLNAQVITNLTQMEFSVDHQRLYLAFNDGQLKYVDESFNLVDFASTPELINGLASVGNFLLAQDASGAWNTHYIFDENGSLVDSKDWNRYSPTYAWSESQSRVYFFRSESSPNDLHYEEIDQVTGLISDSGETPYHGDYNIQAPIVISSDGELILLGSGDLYHSANLTWAGSISSTFDYATWLSDGSLITFSNIDNTTSTVVTRRNSELSIVEEIIIPSEVLAVFNEGDQVLAVVKSSAGVSLYEYIKNDDSDGDTVLNVDDLFPLDIAASVDSDNDGYPDSWNDGYSSSDSTLNLTIDYFPLDSSCWLDEHALDGLCDYSATMPIFVPDAISYDASGNVYLLNIQQSKVYRWVADNERFENPINVGQSHSLNTPTPQKMSYSEQHNRLYLGYEDGSITYIDLNELGQEESFASIAESVDGLAAVGDYVLAQDSSGAWNTHYIFNESGELTDSEDWKDYSDSYVWNEGNNRLYYVDYNNLISEEINQVIGAISDVTESSYYSGQNLSSPIKLSHEGERVLLGSGDIYDATSLELVGDLGIRSLDVISMPEVIVTLRSGNDTDNSVIEFWHDETYELLASETHLGTPIGLFQIDSDIVVLSLTSEGIQVNQKLIADHDQDGMPGWWESIYLLDDSDVNDAHLDNDADGLTNLEEFQQLTHPNIADSDLDGINDGDEVNTYNTNPLNQDSDGDGLVDGDEVTLHSTDPLSTDTDGDTLSDSAEVNDYESNPLLTDSDADGIADNFEVLYGLDINANDAELDPDEDGLSNLGEYTAGTDATIADTDRDGLSDGEEVHTYLTLPLSNDSDNDRIFDGWEVLYGFNPLSDSDASLDEDEDTFSNQVEFFVMTDPTDALSIPQASNWSQSKGSASHNGFVPVFIPSDELSLRWSKDIYSDSYSDNSYIAANESQIFTKYYENNTVYLVSLDAKTGNTFWTKEFSTSSVSEPVIAEDLIHILYSESYNSDGYLESLDINSGETIASHPLNASLTNSNISPTYYDSSLYWFEQSSYSLVNKNASTGEQVWINDNARCYGDISPTVDDEQVYFFNGQFNIVAKNSGDIIEVSEIGNSDSYQCVTPVLGRNNDAFVINNDSLYAYDTNTAQLLWEVNTSGSNSPIWGKPTIALGKVYVIQRNSDTYRNELSVYDEYTGELLWNWSPENGNSLTGDIVVSLNLIFVQDGYNTYAIDLDTQDQVWSYPKSGTVAISSGSALYLTSSNGTTTAIDFAQDSDSDGMDDWWEDLHGLDKNDSSDADLNADTDGLTNLEEYNYSTNPTVDDTDFDGLSDSDEVNTYLSNPNNVDTDGDELPDFWEVNNSLDLLNASDALLDADGDLVSNIDEYLEGTDPNDEISLPIILVDLVESFEEASLPVDWVIDDSKNSSWGESQIAKSDGESSIYSSGESAIEYSAYFTGNTMMFDVQSYCDNNVSVSVAIDGESVQLDNLNNSESWVEYKLDVPRGRHSIRISVNSCGIYLDNVRFSELPHLFETDTKAVAMGNDRTIRFYNDENELTKSVTVPRINNYSISTNHLIILPSGDIALSGNSQEQLLVIYSPKYHTWLFDEYESIDNYNNVKPIASYNNYIFLANTSQYSAVNNEFIRFDILNNTKESFSVEGSYTDLYVRGNLLYGLKDSSVDIYNADTMVLENTYPTLNNANAIVVDSTGNFYVFSQNDQVRKYSSTGVELIESEIDFSNGYSNSTDADIDDQGVIHLIRSNREKIIITDELIVQERDTDFNALNYIAFIPFIDVDEDGMPLWWESKYGLSDADADDALSELDTDGLSNIDEYLNRSNPTIDDTDSDGLNDFDEVFTYLTSPFMSDTDNDTLSDNDELNIHLTDPLVTDTDEDGFDDGVEINLYETDPNDSSSMPEAIGQLSYDFNDQILPSYWVESDASDAVWFIDDVGNDDYAIRSGDIGDNQRSMIELNGLFEEGTFSFDAQVSSESCCDRLTVYVDDEIVINTNQQDWQNYTFQIALGEHTIDFVYSKDSSVSSNDDTVWIDNIVFD